MGLMPQLTVALAEALKLQSEQAVETISLPDGVLHSL
jgi:hypothetical protein